MKKQIMGLIGVVSMMLFSISSYAGTVVWEPSDNNSTAIVLESSTSSITNIAIFDDSDLTLGTILLEFDASVATVLFTEDTSTGDWLITSSDVTTSTATSAILSGSDNFIVAASSDAGVSWTANISYILAAAPDTYELTYLDLGEPNTLRLTDVQPVPVPAAIWLFGSAMFGMVAVGRRKLTGKESLA